MNSPKNKNIAISLLQISPKSVTGVFIYAQKLLDNLLALDKNNHYWLLTNASNHNYFQKRYRKHQNMACRMIDVRRDIFVNPLRAARKLQAKLIGNRLLREEIVGQEIQKLIDKEQIDTLFFPSGIIYPRKLKKIRIVSTICDLQHEYFPENFPKQYRKLRQEAHRYIVARADKIIAISHFTKKTIIERYYVNPEKITVIYLGAEEPKLCSEKLTISQQFIFYPAAIWPHKNHRLLIEALAGLKDTFPKIHLVLTGSVKNIQLKKELLELASSLDLKDRVLFLGYLPETLLPCLYRKAKALVFPSSFEGFGLPLIEAFKYGLPVVAADNSSIREIVGEAGLLFPDNDSTALQAELKKILTNQEIRRKLIESGRKKAATFSWENTARQTLAVLR